MHFYLQYAMEIRLNIIASDNWMREASSLPGAQHSGEGIQGILFATIYLILYSELPLQNPTGACRTLFQGLGWPVR